MKTNVYVQIKDRVVKFEPIEGGWSCKDYPNLHLKLKDDQEQKHGAKVELSDANEKYPLQKGQLVSIEGKFYVDFLGTFFICCVENRICFERF